MTGNASVNLKRSTCDPLKYKMDNSILILSKYMRKCIRMKMVNKSDSAEADPEGVLGVRLKHPAPIYKLSMKMK